MAKNNGSFNLSSGSTDMGVGTVFPYPQPGRFTLALQRWADRSMQKKLPRAWHEEMYSGEMTLTEVAAMERVSVVEAANRWLVWADWKYQLWLFSWGKLGISQSELAVVASVVGHGLMVSVFPLQVEPRRFSFLLDDPSGDDPGSKGRGGWREDDWCDDGWGGGGL